MRHSKLVTVSLVACALIASEALAVAYCAVRHPVAAIQHFFPSYDHYNALDGEIDATSRQRIESILPNVHFKEFGTHTLYVVYQAGQPIGFLHARTEKGDWGLDELVWAFNPDLTVHGVKYQRSRSTGRELIESADFNHWLSGNTVDGLRALLSPDATQLAARPQFVSTALEARIASIIRSGIKALLVCQYTWDIDQLSAPKEPSP